MIVINFHHCHNHFVAIADVMTDCHRDFYHPIPVITMINKRQSFKTALALMLKITTPSKNNLRQTTIV